MIRRRLHPLLCRSIRLSVPAASRDYIPARSLATRVSTAHALHAVREIGTRSSSCLAAASGDASDDEDDDEDEDEDGDGSDDDDEDGDDDEEDDDGDEDADMRSMDDTNKPYQRAGPDPGQIVAVPAEVEAKLSRDIMICNFPKDIETVLQTYVEDESIPSVLERWKRVSPANAVAAFRGLAEKRKRPTDWKELDADFRVNLVTRIQLIIPLLESRHIVTCIWAIARFNGSMMKHPLEERLMRLLCGAVVRLIRSFSPVEISTTMWSLATVEVPNSKRPLALEKLQDRINCMHVPNTFQEHEYSNMVWSMPSLQLMFVTSTKLAEDLMRFGPNAFTTAELASIAMGISKAVSIDIEVRKAALLNIIERAEPRIGVFKQQSLCELCWALANRRISHPTIYTKIAEAVVKLDPPLKSRKNGMDLVWSFTQVSRYPAEMFAFLSTVLRDHLKDLERADFRSLLVAYSHADIHDKEMIESINAELQRRKDEMAEIVAKNKVIRLKKEEAERQEKIAKNRKKMKAKAKRRKAAKKLKEEKLKERREKHSVNNWNFSQFMDF